jgi:cold shock CspA family protein
MKGNIIWYNEKRGFGIILGDDNWEYYFDSSVWCCPVSNPFRNRLVKFEVSTVSGCLCARNIRDLLST